MSSPTPEPAFRNRFAADDWGLSPAVNEAILDLAERGLLRSVSVIANLPYLETGLDRLLRTRVEIAAHLNFTLGRPLSEGARTLSGKDGRFYRYRPFLLRGALGLFDRNELEGEAHAQLARLSEICEPLSANGHEHVQILPWMTVPLATAARKRGIRRWRRMDDRAHPASRVATRWAAKRAERAGLALDWEPTHYLFPTGSWSTDAIRAKASIAGDRALLVHPAARDDFHELIFADSLRAPRVREFRSLRGLAP